MACRLTVFASSLFVFATLSAAPDGKAVYMKECASCHGEKGEGDPKKEGPRLAGKPLWELTWQIERFRKGERPSSPKDAAGLAMKKALENVKDGETIKAVLEFANGLKTPAASETLSGDAKNGENTFALCSTCHGTKGEGNESLKAPRLSAMEGWYLAAQLRKFRTGERGNDASDAQGYPMGLMVQQIPSDKAVHDLIAYIRTLP
ncbi:MAG: c-type cytochrome [Spirochaetia bacterium]|nr:c-type cytochrome [Spirochaetia bacterium]